MDAAVRQKTVQSLTRSLALAGMLCLVASPALATPQTTDPIASQSSSSTPTGSPDPSSAPPVEPSASPETPDSPSSSPSHSASPDASTPPPQSPSPSPSSSAPSDAPSTVAPETEPPVDDQPVDDQSAQQRSAGPAAIQPFAAAAAAPPVTVVPAGSTLSVGQDLVSPNGRFRFVVQSDGNMGVYGPTGAIWASNTSGTNGLVVVGTNGELTFAASVRSNVIGTAGTGAGHRLVLQDDGNLALYSTGSVAIWSSMAGRTSNTRDTMPAPNTLWQGQSLVSNNGAYRLAVQSDGNVGVYGPAGAIWASNTSGTGTRVALGANGELTFAASVRSNVIGTAGTGAGHRLVLQDDGNLALYSAGSVAIWSSMGGRTGNTRDTMPAANTLWQGQSLVSNNGQYRLVLQGDGNVGIYGPSRAIWASNTNGTGTRVAVSSNGELTFAASVRSHVIGTGGTGSGHRLVLQDDGNLALYSTGSVAIWSSMGGRTGNTRSSLQAPSSIHPGQSLVSNNGDFRLVLQGDGNMGLYTRNNVALWASSTVGSPAWGGPTADGDFRVTAGGSSFSAGRGGSGTQNRLVLQDDGNMGLYTSANVAVWASGTAAGRFDPASIITDRAFYDYQAMSESAIDAFLRQQGASCVQSALGVPCLKDYRESTTTRTSTVCEGTYQGAANESAATIIYKVAQACRINPRALLVTLQKEQGLVSASGASLTARKYQIAMGYGCPDGAPCDAQYYGLYNQVFSAAQQFRRYQTTPTSYKFRAGRPNTVGFNPLETCGSTTVYIDNQATAGLYNYTPYQPNAALLGGSADACSSYGNYNFWLFFTRWFGTTR